MYGRITDKIELYLPQIGVLADGRTVSNYNLLSAKTLIAEGWKEIQEVKPTYDEATQYLIVDTAIDNGTNIIVTYKAVEIPLDDANELENLLLDEMGV